MLRILIMAVLIWLTPGVSSAQQGGTELSFRVVRDADPQAGIEDICCGADSRISQAEPVDHVSTRYGNAPLWLKLEGLPGAGLVQVRPVVDNVTLYARSRGSETWQPVKSGDLVPNTERVFATPFIALPLPENVDRSAVYVRIEQPTAVAIKAWHWSLPPFIAMQDADRTLKVFLLGFISAVIIYNLVVSVLVRDPAFALNALCIASLMTMALYLSGYGVAYVWADWYKFSNVFMCLAMLGGIIFGSAFVFTFLRNEGEGAKDYISLLVAPVFATAGCAFLALARAPYWAFQLILLIGIVLILVGMIWSIVRKAVSGDRKGMILLAPLFMALVPGITAVMLDELAGYRPVNLGNNAMEIMLAMEAVLFSLALASRIRITEEAHREAAANLLQSQQRNATIAMTAQDGERRRLAKDLHDSVGQEILVIVSHLKRLANDPKASGFVDRLKEATGMLSTSLDNIRRVSRAMHPSSIEHLGLEGAVRELIDQANSTADIEFSGHVEPGDVEISQDRQLHIVRIIQECLSNVIRHSGATKCDIDLEHHDARLELRIADNGIGIDEDLMRQPDRPGLGLTSVDERVRSLGGTWRMRAAKNGGLVTHVSVPVSGEPALGIPL